MWVVVVEEDQWNEGIWYEQFVFVECWSKKLAAKDHIVAHASVNALHYPPKAYNPFHHGLEGRTNSKRQVGIHIERKSSGVSSHLNQHTGSSICQKSKVLAREFLHIGFKSEQ